MTGPMKGGLAVAFLLNNVFYHVGSFTGAAFGEQQTCKSKPISFHDKHSR